MNLAKLKKLIANNYDQQISDHLVSSFLEIEENFVIKKWKPSELNAGHFVEAVRRIIELELFGKYTPFNNKLPHFNDSELQRYERQKGHESFRMLIPRILKAIYNIRNKRGVGHISDISPNEMDATLILYNVKWVLAEIIRLNSNLKPEETQQIINKIVERDIQLLWKDGEVKRILNPNILAKDKVLVLLYDESPMPAEKIRGIIEYKNSYNFKKILKGLHSDRLIEFDDDNICKISPTGITEAEKILQKSAT
ncbi:hypothetical protein [Fodinibius halophilus]|uniref:Uncharacterized protein n=1 Tax=Fodinibius halophilus TaxID=1736908 RepID=A0A6M1T7M9_9BACT|nr:hypothetical protein [Fodinibius halophilus]NGP90257.1 hypothetical protein [Fodinibius halophilus]